jgi:hypothetical protein
MQSRSAHHAHSEPQEYIASSFFASLHAAHGSPVDHAHLARTATQIGRQPHGVSRPDALHALRDERPACEVIKPCHQRRHGKRSPCCACVVREQGTFRVGSKEVSTFVVFDASAHFGVVRSARRLRRRRRHRRRRRRLCRAAWALARALGTSRRIWLWTSALAAFGVAPNAFAFRGHLSMRRVEWYGQNAVGEPADAGAASRAHIILQGEVDWVTNGRAHGHSWGSGSYSAASWRT